MGRRFACVLCAVRAVTCAACLVIDLISGAKACASTFQQVPFVNRQVTVDRVTRSFTVNHPNIDREVFGELAGGGSFNYYDGTQLVQVVVAVDPLWNRVVYSTDIDGDPIRSFGGSGSGNYNFFHPSDIAVSQGIFVADTGNDRILGFAFTPDGAGLLPPRSVLHQFTVIDTAAFSKPNRICWDDNGTPTNSVDNVIWVLDPHRARIAAYHVYHNGNMFFASPYVQIRLRELCPGAVPRHPVALAKRRSFTSPDARGSYCTDELIVYDNYNDEFVILRVPHAQGAIADPAAAVTWTTKPNPLPGSLYSDLESDPWGNTLGAVASRSLVVKLDIDMALIESFGVYGPGPIGSNQFIEPSSLSMRRSKEPDGSITYTSDMHVFERWSDTSGIQVVRLGMSLRNASAALIGGSDSVAISYLNSDHGRMTVEIREAGTNVLVRTLKAGIVESAGLHAAYWDGVGMDGHPVPPCGNYVAKVRAVGLYDSPDDVSVDASFQYRPKRTAALLIGSNVPNARVAVDGAEITVGPSGYALPCSLCSTRSISAQPSQVIAGTRYCFDGWSDGVSRVRTISVTKDSSIALSVTAGPGPTAVPANAAVLDEAYDCKSPYVFQGSASLSNRAGWDSFRVYGNVKFQFPMAQGSETRAYLNIGAPAVMKGAIFETVAPTGTQTPGLWEGVSLLGPNGSLDCDSCTVRNARIGVSAPATFPTRALRVRRSRFEYNEYNDINVAVEPSLQPAVRRQLKWDKVGLKLREGLAV